LVYSGIFSKNFNIFNETIFWALAEADLLPKYWCDFFFQGAPKKNAYLKKKSHDDGGPQTREAPWEKSQPPLGISNIESP
jgi:hypothetical protein